MQNLWSDSDAKAAIAQHATKGIGEDLALRVYTTRLLGGEPQAGAAWRRQHLGEDAHGRHHRRDDRRAVRQGQRLGHGHDRGARPAGGAARAAARAARPAGAVRRGHGQRPAQQPARRKSPNPSVETLLHAFLPHKFIDHTHSNAVLALTDQPDGEALAADVYGKRAALVPYVMPGFALAKKMQRGRPGQSRRRRADPAEARHLLDGRDGGRSLCAHDRPGDLAEQRLAKATRKIFPGATLAREDRDGGRDRADPARADVAPGQGAAAARRRSASCSSSAPIPEILALSAARRSPATASRGR